MGDSFTGLVGFSVSAYGAWLAGQYKKHDAELAARVYSCYQVNEKAAKSVGEPMAECFVAYFPQKYVETAVKAVDPLRFVGAAYFLFKSCQDNEKLVVADYQRRLAAANRARQEDKSGLDYNTPEELINQSAAYEEGKAQEQLGD